MLTTILVPLDGSPFAERAVPFASKLARAARGWVVLAHVLSPPDLDAPEQERACEAALGRVADRIRADGIAADTSICGPGSSDTASALAGLVHQRRADLVVMSTHGRGGLGRLLHGSVADGLIRGASVPIVLIPSRCETAWPTNHPPRIMVPLDGSALSAAALPPAAELADAMRAGLLLVRVVEPPTLAPFEADEALARARRELEAAAARLRTGSRVIRTRVVGGFAIPTIPSLAREEQIDLIAMATRGRGGLARAALGSVATEILQRATVPLLLVGPTALPAGATGRRTASAAPRA